MKGWPLLFVCLAAPLAGGCFDSAAGGERTGRVEQPLSVCGNGICETPDEWACTCPQDCPGPCPWDGGKTEAGDAADVGDGEAGDGEAGDGEAGDGEAGDGEAGDGADGAEGDGAEAGDAADATADQTDAGDEQGDAADEQADAADVGADATDASVDVLDASTEKPPPDVVQDPITEAPCSCASCDGDPMPAPVNVALGYTLDGTTSCPLFGGKVGVEVKFQATGGGKPAQCEMAGGSPKCSGVGEIGADLKVTFHSCAEYFFAGGTHKIVDKNDYCTKCNQLACLYQCDKSRRCNRFSQKGSVYGGKGWVLGKQWEKQLRFGAASAPAIRVSADCGAKIEVGGSYTAGTDYTRNTNFNCGECIDCQKDTYEGALTAEGKLKCEFKLGLFDLEPWKFGCAECASGFVQVSVGGGSQSGACGSKDCVSVGGKVGAKLNPIDVCANLIWYRVGVRMGAGASIAGTYNSCSGGSWSPSIDYNVQVIENAQCSGAAQAN